MQGAGEGCVPELLGHNVVKAVSLTGSCAAGEAVAGLIGAHDIRFQAELGGSNAVVVCADADIESVAGDVVSAAFACGGQWCTGTGRVIVERPVHEAFVKAVCRLVEGMGGNRPGNGIGAQANARQLESVRSLVDSARSEGAVLACQGAVTDTTGTENHFPATVLSGITAEMRCAKGEVFGPVLLIFEAHDFDHAIALMNASEFGLSVSLYCKDPGKTERFIEQAEAGLVHVNLPTSHRALDAPLFGWKSSGRGWPECGPQMLDFFTIPKVVYRK